MNKKRLIIIGVVVAIMLIGVYFDLRNRIDNIGINYIELERQINHQQKQINHQQKQINRFHIDSILRDSYKIAVLNPTEKGYSRLYTKSGFSLSVARMCNHF